MTKETKIYVVGQDIISKDLTYKLQKQGYKNILTTDYNPYDKQKLKEFFIKNKPEIVVLDPSKDVDGYLQNRYIFSGHLNQVKRIIKFNNFMHQKEYSKLITNIHYDVFYTDSYLEENPISEIVRTMHEAKIYGDMYVGVESGLQPLNILFLDDLTDAIVHIMKLENKGRTINVDNCCEMNLRNVAYILKDIIKYEGDLRYEDVDEEEKKPMISINDLGWKARYNFETTIRKIYNRLIDKHKYFMVSNIIVN